MLRVLLVMILGLGAQLTQAAPRTRMVMKIRPVGRAIDVPVAGSLNYIHVDLDDPEVSNMASFAATALSYTNLKSETPLDLMKVTSAAKRTDSNIHSDYKLTLVLHGEDQQYYYCNAAVSERVTNMTKESSHREVHLAQPSSCIEGPEGLILATKDSNLPAALFAASELSKSVLVLNSTLTLRQVAEWHPTEKYFGNEYKLNLVFANNENGQLNCLAEVLDRISHQDKQLVRVDCSPAAAGAGPSDSVDDVEEIAEFVTAFLKESRNLDLSLLRVSSAEKIPFQGVKIKPSLVLSTNSSENGEEVLYYCNAAVFQDEKSGDYELIRSHTTCSNSPPKAPSADPVLPEKGEEPAAPGSYTDVPVDDVQVKQMAAFATSALSSSMNAGGDLVLIKIRSAQRQIVAGTNHQLTLDLESSTGGDSLHCMVVVFDQPWTSTRELSEAMCRPGDSVRTEPAAAAAATEPTTPITSN